MRTSHTSQSSRTQKKDIIKMNESKKMLSEEVDEEVCDEPTAKFFTRSSPKNGDSSEEPEEDPEELEDDSEVEPEEDPEEELEEDPEEELEEDPEEDPEEESSEYPEQETAEECVKQTSCHNNDETEQLSEDPDEDPSEEYVSEPSSGSDTNEADHNCSNGKKRSADTTAFGCTPLQVNQSQKKCRYEEAFNRELDVRSAVTDLGSESGKQRRSRWEPQPEQDGGSSGKRRRSRWEPQPEQDGETGGGDGNSKRRKTRWASDDSQLKLLGPLQLPDFKEDFVGFELDPEIRGLQSRLFEINKKLQNSKLHDDRPEGERSPSPEPVFNNLGLRINTREVRLRQKLKGERQLIISKLIKKNPTFKTPPKNIPLKLSKKVYIPVKEYPEYNFVGLIMGPRGNTQKRMEKETGARILLRGKGSKKIPQKPDPSDNDDLHVCIEAGDQNSLDAALVMVEKLLIPLESNEHKRAQLEELARLKGTLRSETCHECKEEGHKAYACPQRPSGLNAIPCDTCGSVRHPTTSCSAVSTKQKPNKEPDDAKLYVGYLPQAVDDNRLRELFSPFGKIASARVIMDRTTGLSKGYGFVNFESPVEASAAVMHMNGYQTDGKMLAVRVAGRQAVTGPTIASPSVATQAAWIGLPGSLPPGAQPSFPNSQGVVMPLAFIYSGHGTHLPNFGPTLFPPPSVVSSLGGESMNAFSSPGLVAQFPGDPDYPGSEFKQYFTSPTYGPSQPLYFNQTPETQLKPTSWASSRLPR